jgi:hypothetical protein
VFDAWVARLSVTVGVAILAIAFMV